MKVLFIKDVGGVGKHGTIKEVADGYALNSLIPKGLAVQATAQRLAEFEKKQAEILKTSAENNKRIVEVLKKINGTKIVIASKANEQGHLFKGVKLEDVLAELNKVAQVGFISAHMIEGFAGTIKNVGVHMLTVNGAGTRVNITLDVQASKK